MIFGENCSMANAMGMIPPGGLRTKDVLRTVVGALLERLSEVPEEARQEGAALVQLRIIYTTEESIMQRAAHYVMAESDAIGGKSDEVGTGTVDLGPGE